MHGYGSNGFIFYQETAYSIFSWKSLCPLDIFLAKG